MNYCPLSWNNKTDLHQNMCTRKLVTENMCEKTNKLRQFPTRWIPSYEELKSQKHSKQHRQLCQKDKKICPLRCVCVCVNIHIYITMNCYLQWNLHTGSFEMFSYHLCFFFFKRGWYFGVFSTICSRVINWRWSNIWTSLDG